MKALSLWQPWASLIAIGAKRIETRGWSTSIRGDVAIHASKYRDPDVTAMCGAEPFRSVLLAAFFPDRAPRDVQTHELFDVLPRGVLLCVCKLEDCSPILGGGARGYLSNGTIAQGNEYAFGDYSPGRYGFVLGLPRQLAKPVGYRGSQRFFDVPDSDLGTVLDVIQPPARSSGGLFEKGGR